MANIFVGHLDCGARGAEANPTVPVMDQAVWILWHDLINADSFTNENHVVLSYTMTFVCVAFNPR